MKENRKDEIILKWFDLVVNICEYDSFVVDVIIILLN